MRTQQVRQYVGNLLKVFQQKIHYCQMAQINSSRKSSIFPPLKPTLYRRIRAGTNGGNLLVTYAPLDIKLFRRHAQLALAVNCNQIAFSICQSMRLFHPHTSLNLLPTPYQIDTPAALLESGANQIM